MIFQHRFYPISAFEAGTPLQENGAKGSSSLDADQKAAIIGDPVPIVFCRRNDNTGTGGILIAPLATEARFENSQQDINGNYTNEVTVYWHLVLSEGQIGSIQRRDVFWRGYRVGTYTQTYNRRAGTWTPGNYITDRAAYTYTPECPKYCGNIGTYPGISTLSFSFVVPNTNIYNYSGTVVYTAVPNNEDWKKQISCFVRNGMYVTRLVDSVLGSSSNYADLVQWLYQNSSKLATAQIDTAALTTAANFLHVNGFACDIEIKESGNLADFIAKTASYFLLRESRNGGKRGLRPLLPITAAYAINTNPIAWAFTFTEENILPDTLDIQYTSLSDRRPFCVQVMWRQQPTDDFGTIRTSEVRYVGTAENGPYEQHDMSAFCTNENHAVKVGTYILARRRYVTHTATVALKPGDYSKDLAVGDVIRLYLQRNASCVAPAVHDYLYEVDKITKTLAGDLALELTHLPIDDVGRNIVAVEVATAVGNGVTLSSNRTGPTRDTYGSGDTSVPAEAYTVGTALDEQVSLTPMQIKPPSGDRTPAGDALNNQPLEPAQQGTEAILVLPSASTPYFLIDGATQITCTVNGSNISVSEGTGPFGDNSLYTYVDNDEFEGYLTATWAALELGTDDYTIEAWVKYAGDSVISSNIWMIGDYGSSDTNFNYVYSDGSDIVIYETAPPSTTNNFSSTGAGMVAGEWYHVAASRKSGTLRLFLDGTEVGSSSTAASFGSAMQSIMVSSDEMLGYDGLSRYISNMRINAGYAYYDTNFTPPTEPF